MTRRPKASPAAPPPAPPGPASPDREGAVAEVLARACAAAEQAAADPSLRGALPKAVAAELLFSLQRALRK